MTFKNMVYEEFKKVIEAIREADKFMDDAYKLGINLIDSPFYVILPKLYKPLFISAFGEDGLDWIEWYLYELPNIISYDKKHPEKESTSYASDSDGKPIDVSSDESFYEFLAKEYLIKDKG